jgi:hypothetical protein
MLPDDEIREKTVCQTINHLWNVVLIVDLVMSLKILCN